MCEYFEKHQLELSLVDEQEHTEIFNAALTTLLEDSGDVSNASTFGKRHSSRTGLRNKSSSSQAASTIVSQSGVDPSGTSTLESSDGDYEPNSVSVNVESVFNQQSRIVRGISQGKEDTSTSQ